MPSFLRVPFIVCLLIAIAAAWPARAPETRALFARKGFIEAP